jgi:hypothetical protein
VLKLASATVVALLVMSPALAKNTTIAPSAPNAVCTPLDAVLAQLAGKKPVLIKLDGAKLDAFKTANPGKFPVALDLILVLGEKADPLFVTLGFTKGCVIGHGYLSPDVALPLIGVQVDDGSI